MPHKLTRREFIESAVATTAFAASGVVHAAPARRPNVLFILADDLGYGDLSCYGRPDYRDAGARSACAPGTEVHQQLRGGAGVHADALRVHHGPVSAAAPRRPGGAVEIELPSNVGLPPEHPTIASLLKANGYDTSLVGKWHLGWKPEFGPNRHGFDEFFGVLSGAVDYFTHKAADAPAAAPTVAPILWQNLAPIERVGYLTDLLSDKAVEVISRPHAKPFFLSLHYTAPHSPWEGPEDEAIGHTTHGPGPMIEGGSLKIYGAMMKSMDAGIGRVLKALERAKIDRDTLVIFTSDNGGERYSYNWPFSFQKMYLYEGGTRVPAIVRWPGVIPAGRVTDQPAITMDWTATILGVTGTPRRSSVSARR